MPEHESGIDPRFRQTVGAGRDLCGFLPVSIHGLIRKRCPPFYQRGPGHDGGRVDMGGDSLSAHIDASADAFRQGGRHKGQEASVDGGRRDLCRGLCSVGPRPHRHGTDSCPRRPGKRRCNACQHSTRDTQLGLWAGRERQGSRHQRSMPVLGSVFWPGSGWHRHAMAWLARPFSDEYRLLWRCCSQPT